MKNWVCAGVAVLALSACGEGMTSRATDDRLAELLADGVDPTRLERIEARAARAQERNSSVGDLLADFGADAPPEGSADLTELLAFAQARNTTIGRAAQGINRADAERLNAIFGYLPQISASATLAQNQQEVIESDNAVFQLGVANYPSLDASVELAQPLFDLSRIYSIQLANTARTAAEVGYVATVQDVMYEVFDTYVAAVQARNRVSSLTQQRVLINAQVNAETARESAGESGRAAVSALRVEVSSIGLDLAQETLRYERLLADLSRLTGVAVTGVDSPRAPLGMFGTERRVSVEQAIASAAENNPRLLEALVGVAEGDIRRRQAIAADFSPVLTAFARYVYEDRDASRFGGGSVSADTVLGVRLVVPIFNAQGDGMENLTARIDFRDAYIQYLATQREIATEISSTHRRLTATAASLGEAQASLRGLNAIVASERALVTAGESQEYLVAALRAQALEGQERVAFYQLEYLRAWAQFEYLSGLNLADRL